MLDEAFAKIPAETNLILHSDQGWQYQHKQYQQMLREKGVRQSMSRKGNCLDNAVIENFFGLLKSELLYLQEFRSMEHFKLELIEYLDYYNNRRIKAKLKGLPPAIHRQQALSAAWTIFTSKYCLTFGGHFMSGFEAIFYNYIVNIKKRLPWINAMYFGAKRKGSEPMWVSIFGFLLSTENSALFTTVVTL